METKLANLSFALVDSILTNDILKNEIDLRMESQILRSIPNDDNDDEFYQIQTTITNELIKEILTELEKE